MCYLPKTTSASVDDYREVEQISLRQDWTWSSSQTHLAQWGIEVTYLNALYDYSNSAEYFGLQAMFEGQPESSSFNSAHGCISCIR